MKVSQIWPKHPREVRVMRTSSPSEEGYVLGVAQAPGQSYGLAGLPPATTWSWHVQWPSGYQGTVEDSDLVVTGVVSTYNAITPREVMEEIEKDLDSPSPVRRRMANAALLAAAQHYR